MKRLLIAFMLLTGASTALRAQNVNSTAVSQPVIDSTSFDIVSQQMLKNYYIANGGDSGRSDRHYQRWQTFWSQRIAKDIPDSIGFLRGTVVSAQLDKELRFSCLGSGFRGAWQCMGPFRNSFGYGSHGSGRIQSIWADPSNVDYILAASSSGGLWKTTDGGQNWANITDQSLSVITGTMAISNIAVNPLNHNIIYLTTGTQNMFVSHWNGDFGLGPIYSTDGGTSWHADMDFRQIAGTLQTAGVGDATKWVNKMAYEPNSNKLYAISDNRIFRKSTVNGTWENITPSLLAGLSSDYYFTDFQFTYNPAGKVVFSTNCVGHTQYLITFNEATQGWSTIPVVIPNYFTPGTGWGGLGINAFGISSSNEVYMGLFLARVSDTVLRNMIYKIDLNTGSNLTAVSTNFNGSGFTSYNSLHQIVVSPANPDIIYIVQADGGTSHIVMKSTDGGANFSNICKTHADGRFMFLYHAGTDPEGIGDILFAGTDGGIAKKSAGDIFFHSIMGDGICITQFYGLSTDPTNDAYMTAGAQDNNSQNYNAETADPWNQPSDGGDGLRPGFANNGVHISYSQTKSWKSQISKFSFSSSGVSQTVIKKPDDEYKDPSFERRLKFDQNNLARVGYHYIWQKEITDLDWHATFGEYPNTVEPKPWDPTKGIIRDKLSIDFIFPESAPNVAYLAYGGTTDTTPTVNDTLGRLFYADDIHNPNGFSWTNITPSLVQYAPLTDIETDPANPDRIWACFGGVQWSQYQGDIPPGQRQNRVYFSNDHGSHWQDVSKGITALPIHKIIYVPGSDDLLFAATDIGVYRWNKSAAQWECYNNGMPRQIVTDIEYIPCSGKLRASTYGRGIWETTILPDQSDYLPGETNIINTNTTWNSSKSITGGIRVKTGATLTISGASTKIYMPRRAVITVEKGAKLIVDGATITNECHECEWGGIALTGDVNQPPYPQYQGSLVLKNNATLENAFIAINNYSWDNGAQGGGLIDATNSTIRNCWRAVALNFYDNYSYKSQSVLSKCRFDRMSFEIDNAEMYEIHGAPDYFTSFDTKGGVEITNSTFTNTISSGTIPQNKRGRGIYTLATGLKVQNCTFTGLNEGVHCEGYARLPTRIVSVFLSDFSNINHGITLAGTAYANIKGNTIHNMTLNSFDLNGAYGIYLNHSKGAYVGCHNAIDGNFNGTHISRYGIIINDSRKNATTVIDNTFTNMYVGTQAQKMNVGLNIFCNDYENNDYAWAINPQSANNWFHDQGNGCQPTQIRAGNTFKNNQKDILSYAATWSYYAGNGPYEIPAWWAGAMSLFQCTTHENSQCNDFASCVYDWSSELQGQVLSQYSQLKADGFKMRADGLRLYGHIIRGFNYLDEEPQLQSFLEAENDDRSRKLLIPMYIQKGMYDQATNTIRQLSLREVERTGYNNYYNLLINLRQSDRRPDSLTASELTMVEGLAADTLEVSPYAKGYLDWWYQQKWENPIEPLPQSRGTNEVLIPETPGYIATTLGNAVPNPTSSKTTVEAYIGSRDAMKHPVFIIRNTMGKEMYRRPLEAGENHIEVNTNTWNPGIYVYNLILNNAVSASKKLSVTK